MHRGGRDSDKPPWGPAGPGGSGASGPDRRALDCIPEDLFFLTPRPGASSASSDPQDTDTEDARSGSGLERPAEPAGRTGPGGGARSPPGSCAGETLGRVRISDWDSGSGLEGVDRRGSKPGNDPEDWAVFDVLVRQPLEDHGEDEKEKKKQQEEDVAKAGKLPESPKRCGGLHHHQVDDFPPVLTPDRLTEDAMAHDVATTLRSELAALQYKRDRLLTELQDMKGQLRCREQRALELQVESDQLREQAARQSSVIASLRKRVQELEERERSASCSLGRADLAVQTLQRESRQAAERVSELEAKLRRLELECHEEEGLKDAARTALSDLVRRLAAALGAELVDASPEVLLVRAAELVQEAGRLRARAGNMCESLQSAEQELRNCREALQRQQAAHLCELDRVKQDKEAVELAHRCTERELADVREKLAVTSRSLGACTSNCAQQESAICSLREEVKIREEKWLRLQNELRHLLESLAIMVSSPSRFVESTEGCIKERIREILSDNKDLVVQMDTLRDKACGLQQQLGRQSEIAESSSCRARVLEEDKAILESRLHKVESDLTACDVAREALRRDKCTFMEFLDRLGRALNMEEVSKDIGVEMHTEALLVRADQLARLESDKMVDKLLLSGMTLPRLRRPRSPRELPGKETAAVYQLQRRVRTLREQLQRRDLHLDLLRRKLALQVDSCRARAVVESERDEISLRNKKLQKKVDCLQLQLAEARTLNRDLKAQLADAADCKITALERARRIEELQKRLMDAEVVRTQYNRKVNILKDQVRATAQTANQERSLGEHAAQLLREDLASSKAALAEAARKETQLVSFRSSVCKLLNVDLPASDYEILARLQKLIAAHRDFTLVSRRWDHNEPLPLAVPCTPPPPVHRPLSPHPHPHRPLSARCLADDLNAELNSVLDDIDDINGIYNKRPHRLAS